MQDLIGYDEIIESSMRSVIYETLKKVEKTGLPGGHHFVITFLTRYPETKISDQLRNKYPDEMTIAIQYQYKSLKVKENNFEISLSFGGKYENLSIPYRSITSFADPSMNFALKFTMSYQALDDINDDFDSEIGNNDQIKEKKDIDLNSKVVSLDAFRNNRDDNK